MVQEKPFYLKFGYQPLLPNDIIRDLNPPTYATHTDYISTKVHELQKAYKRVKKNITRAAETQENYQCTLAKERSFDIGQLVYLYNPAADRNLHIVKRRNYSGPKRIDNPTSKPYKVNVNRLIPYIQRKDKLSLVPSLERDMSNFSIRENDQSNLPHATFSEIPDPLILFPHTNGNIGHSLPPQTSYSPISNNRDSQDTIIYSLDDLQALEKRNTLSPTRNAWKTTFPTLPPAPNSPSVPLSADTFPSPILVDLHPPMLGEIPTVSDHAFSAISSSSKQMKSAIPIFKLSKPTRKPKPIQIESDYKLRDTQFCASHENLADRLFNWSMKATQTNQEDQPPEINYLTSLANKL